MDLQSVMSELESMGSEENRNLLAQQGVSGPMFGVGADGIDHLASRIGTNHALAVELWNSGNHDARLLATRLADPAQMTTDMIDNWSVDAADGALSDAVADLVARLDDSGAADDGAIDLGDDNGDSAVIATPPPPPTRAAKPARPSRKSAAKPKRAAGKKKSKSKTRGKSKSRSKSGKKAARKSAKKATKSKTVAKKNKAKKKTQPAKGSKSRGKKKK